jgi:hypothetical protein
LDELLSTQREQRGVGSIPALMNSRGGGGVMRLLGFSCAVALGLFLDLEPRTELGDTQQGLGGEERLWLGLVSSCGLARGGEGADELSLRVHHLSRAVECRVLSGLHIATINEVLDPSQIGARLERGQEEDREGGRETHLEESLEVQRSMSPKLNHLLILAVLLKPL